MISWNWTESHLSSIHTISCSSMTHPHPDTRYVHTHARNTRTIECLAPQYDELDHDVNICRISDIASELTEKHSDAGVVAKIARMLSLITLLQNIRLWCCRVI